MGHWLLRGEVTAIIAPGGTGKSTVGNAIALSLASGRPLLGKPLHRGALGVWVFNLEEGLTAAGAANSRMQHLLRE